MTSSRLRAGVLAIAASLLAGCRTTRSDGSPCPPVVAYSRDFLACAAGELDALPAGSAIEQMLADHQAMRDQAPSACRVSGVCAPSTLRPCAGKKTRATVSTSWKWRARAETTGTTLNVGNLAIAVLQLEATPATARRRYMGLVG